MYFNFEENHPDTPRLASPLTFLERALLTTVVYLVVVILAILVPRTEWYQARLVEQEQARQRLQQLQEQQARQRENARFVFMSPRIEVQPPKPPPVAELSDLDRRASSPERAPDPKNSLPFARGNTPERVDSGTSNGHRDKPQPTLAPPAGREADSSDGAVPLAESRNGQPRQPVAERPQTRGSSTGVLAEAIRNVQKYAGGESFHNPQGGAPHEQMPFIQFDSKGVEFGPWLRRFVAQIRRNWFIPYAAMTMKGHVVVTFYVHKDGRITDVQVLKPSSVDAFTNSAHNAIAASNPTVALPPEYPDDKAFFTVTFYFNETPPR